MESEMNYLSKNIWVNFNKKNITSVCFVVYNTDYGCHFDSNNNCRLRYRGNEDYRSCYRYSTCITYVQHTCGWRRWRVARSAGERSASVGRESCRRASRRRSRRRRPAGSGRRSGSPSWLRPRSRATEPRCPAASRTRLDTPPASRHRLYACRYYSAPDRERRVLWWACLSVCLFVCVCLSTIISPERHVRSSPYFLCLLPVAVARSSYGGVMMCYVFPVLWMTSYLNIN